MNACSPEQEEGEGFETHPARRVRNAEVSKESKSVRTGGVFDSDI